MLQKLASLSKTASTLREAKMKKEANLGLAVAKGVGKAALGVGKWAVKNPGKAFGIGSTLAAAVPTAVGQYQQHKRNFDPAYQSQKLNTLAAPGGA